jgi:phosphoglycerate-specific signal transduction histidine kinase
VKTINSRGKTIAILILSKGKNGEPYKEPDLDYISTALSHVSFAFDNTHLIRELRNSYNELKEIQQKLVNYERVAAIHQTVVTLNDKINSPLTVIQGHVELIRKSFGSGNEKINQSLDQIEESVQKCTEIMLKLKNISQPVVKVYADLKTPMIDIDNLKIDREE